MRKVDYQQEISESESELRMKYEGLTSSKLQERCEILLWLKSGKVETMKAAVGLKGRSVDYCNKLWKRYKTLCLSDCLELKYNPQKSPLLGKEELAERLSKDGFSTIKEAQSWILSTYGIKYTENGLGNYFRHNKIKLKTGRPQHPKQDEQKRSVYKKYEEELKQSAPWFQDEMRYGTRTIIGKKWTSQGNRPKTTMKYGYKYSYLFQATQPSTGKTFEMYLPNMSGDCFKLFMEEFAKMYPGQLMIMDNAGCHHVKWEEQNRPFPDVRIEYLPPYSPDFNPQEMNVSRN